MVTFPLIFVTHSGAQRPPERKRDPVGREADAPVGRVGRVVGATVSVAMTAKEKLRERVEALSEQQAADALRVLDERADR